MVLHTEWIRYGDNGQYSGYSAKLSAVKETLPSVIVLQEIWGVDDHIRDVTERLAKAGYVAFAPDLFARDGSREDALGFERIDAAKRFMSSISSAVWRNPEERQAALSGLPDEQQKNISETLERIYNLKGYFKEFEEQIAATAAFLRDSYEYSEGMGVASVGFCMGGTLSGALAAKDAQLRGAVIFYGSSPDQGAVDKIRCPILGFYGELDQRINDGIPPFAESMNKAGKSFEYHIYPNAPHAFFNDTRPSYHVSSARDSFARLLSFLQRLMGERK